MNHLPSCTTPDNCWCEFRSYNKVFWLGAFILALEVGGGVLSGSLGLLADAGHVATDLAGIVVGLVVAYAVLRTRNVGLYHAGGWIVIGLLLVIAGWILHEALQRFGHLDAHEVHGIPMLVVAVIGAWLNRRQHQILHRLDADHTMHRGLIVHVDSDYWQSIVVIIGAGIIALGSWIGVDLRIVDPILSVGIGIWIVWQAHRLITEGYRADHDHEHEHHHH